jgi:hypothetical protein
LAARSVLESLSRWCATKKTIEHAVEVTPDAGAHDATGLRWRNAGTVPSGVNLRTRNWRMMT